MYHRSTLWQCVSVSEFTTTTKATCELPYMWHILCKLHHTVLSETVAAISLSALSTVTCSKQLAHSRATNLSLDTDHLPPLPAPPLWWHVKKTPPSTNLQIRATITTQYSMFKFSKTAVKFVSHPEKNVYTATTSIKKYKNILTAVLFQNCFVCLRCNTYKQTHLTS